MDPLTQHQQKALMAPLSRGRIQHRQQSNVKLSYLAAWDVKATLIRVFGYGGFDAEVTESKIVDMREVPGKNNKTNWKVSAQSTVRLHIHQLNATYTETAIGGSTQPDITESLDMAQKTASSDALKRAAIYLGTQFGLSLYDNGSEADVVKIVFAPGQQWRAGKPVEEAKNEIDQEAVNEATGTTGVTPEQRADNEALVRRAMNARAQKISDQSDDTDPTDGQEADNYGQPYEGMR